MKLDVIKVFDKYIIVLDKSMKLDTNKVFYN